MYSVIFLTEGWSVLGVLALSDSSPQYMLYMVLETKTVFVLRLRRLARLNILIFHIHEIDDLLSNSVCLVRIVHKEWCFFCL